MSDKCTKVCEFSGGRITLNTHGEAFNSEGNRLYPIYKEGKYILEVRSSNGSMISLDFTRLILKTFCIGKDIHCVFDNVDVTLKNKTSLDFRLSNLFYRFQQGPVEVLEGFYLIPFFTDYCISKNGDVLNRTTRKFLTAYPTKPKKGSNEVGGYLMHRLKKDDGKSVIIGKHRLLCLTFMNYAENIDEMVTNHIDGKPWNNELSNLELVTRAENLEHAKETELISSNCSSVVLRNTFTNQECIFHTLRECAKFLGYVNGDMVRKMIDQILIRPDGYMVKQNDGSPWVNPSRVIYQDIEVWCLEILTGKIVKFDSALAAADATGNCDATVRLALKVKSKRPYSGFAFASRAEELPQYTDEFKKLVKSIGCPNLRYNSTLLKFEDMVGQVTYFESIDAVSSKFNMRNDVVSQQLKKTKYASFMGHKVSIIQMLKE